MVTTVAPEQLRLLLVDDHPPIREVLRLRLDAVPRFRVVGEAGGLSEALVQLAATSPHLVIVDVQLGAENDGIQLVREVGRRRPEARVLVWSMHNHAEYVAAMDDAGARGYVLKERPTQEVISAIKVVAGGARYYSHGIERTLAPVSRLTPRELEVLELVECGEPSRKIARVLGINCRTVETHRSNIMSKLDARNTAEMIAIAIRLRLIRDCKK